MLSPQLSVVGLAWVAGAWCASPGLAEALALGAAGGPIFTPGRICAAAGAQRAKLLIGGGKCGCCAHEEVQNQLGELGHFDD
jgi:hypothetical protein